MDITGLDTELNYLTAPKQNNSDLDAKISPPMEFCFVITKLITVGDILNLSTLRLFLYDEWATNKAQLKRSPNQTRIFTRASISTWWS